MKRILTLAIAVLASAGAAIAANWNIRDIDVRVRLYPDGSAVVREIWDMNAQEGTEVYIPRENLGDIEISGFSVSEDGERFLDEGGWDTDRPLSRKAGRSGINRTGCGLELCWGLGSYGHHVFELQYTMSNVVKSLQDYDMMHLQLVNDEMAAQPAHVKVSVEAVGSPMDTTWVRAWGFGYVGDVSFSDGAVVYESTEHFQYSSSVISLIRFDKGVFSSSSIQDRPFQDVLDRAMEGADFYKDYADDDEGWLAFLLFVFSVGLPLYAVYRSAHLSKRQKRRILGKLPEECDWYRDVPFNGDIFKTDYVLDVLKEKKPGNAVASAIILRLIQKGYLGVRKDDRDRVEIYFVDGMDLSALDGGSRGLYDMMLEASGSDRVLQDKEFSRWSSRQSNQSKIRSWANRLTLDAAISLKTSGQYAGGRFTAGAGREEAQHVFGMKKFLNDFTLSSERESQEVHLWQDYLVYASLFGIAKKVAKELRDINPQAFDEVMVGDYPTVIRVIDMSDGLSRSITNARVVAQQSAGGYGGHSSFGGGGGFSGGGHGGGVR